MALHWTARGVPFWRIFPESTVFICSEFRWKPWLPLTAGVNVLENVVAICDRLHANKTGLKITFLLFSLTPPFLSNASVDDLCAYIPQIREMPFKNEQVQDKAYNKIISAGYELVGVINRNVFGDQC